MRTWALLALVVGCNSSPASNDVPSPGLEEAEVPIRALLCKQGGNKGGKRLGTLLFPQAGKPALTLDAQGAEADEFKANWEKLYASGKIKVKVHEARDTERPLVGLVASPGEPLYGRVVLLKMAEQYGYACQPQPAVE